MDKFLKAAQKNFSSPKALSGADAARLIANSPHEPYNVVGFNADEAKRLKVVQGQMVTIIPDDTGNYSLLKSVTVHSKLIIPYYRP